MRETTSDRAEDRCEYCQLEAFYFPGSFHVDHIEAYARTKSTELVNLAFACPPCNTYKSNKTEAEDPVTGKVVRLFNPRTDDWEKHFAWMDDGVTIEGLTEIGRATVFQLQMNDPSMVQQRKMIRLWKEIYPDS